MTLEAPLPRLICPVCGYEQRPVPSHCETQMHWVLEGTFRKKEKLECRVCGFRIDVPNHCGVSMWYSSAEYHDLPSPTPLDYEGMKEAARKE